MQSTLSIAAHRCKWQGGAWAGALQLSGNALLEGYGPGRRELELVILEAHTDRLQDHPPRALLDAPGEHRAEAEPRRDPHDPRRRPPAEQYSA